MSTSSLVEAARTSTSVVKGGVARWWGLIGVLIIQAAAFVVRLPNLHVNSGARNSEASWHVLLTVKALSTTPWSRHLGLPIVSLGLPQDKSIPWGSAIHTVDGNYIYTSFPPLGFIAPWLFQRALHLQPTMRTLFIFNLTLGLAAAWLLYRLVRNVLIHEGANDRTATAAALTAVAVYTFSREALASTGQVYWGQSLNQVLIIAQLLLLWRILRTGHASGRVLAGLAALVACSCYTEWTGFVLAGLAAVVLLITGIRTRARALLTTSAVLLTATATTLLILVAHFTLAIGFHPTIAAFKARANVRGGAAVDHQAMTGELLRGYWLSFAPMLLLGLLAAAILTAQRRHHPVMTRPTLLIVVLATAPLVENALMMQHASEWTYDRLKAAIPLAVVIGLAAIRLRTRVAVGLVPLAAVAVAVGLIQFRADNADYSRWSTYAKSNEAVANSVRKAVDVRCAVFGDNIDVRGYVNLLFNRGVYEFQPQPVDLRARPGGSCASVHLRTTRVLNMIVILEAVVQKPDGTVLRIPAPQPF